MIGFLHCALHAQFDVAASVRYMTFILDLMHKALPLMLAIWEYSANASHGRDQAIDQDMAMRQKLHDALEAGRIDIETVVMRATLAQTLSGDASEPASGH